MIFHCGESIEYPLVQWFCSTVDSKDKMVIDGCLPVLCVNTFVVWIDLVENQTPNICSVEQHRTMKLNIANLN